MSDQDKNGKPQRPSSTTPDISSTTPDVKKTKKPIHKRVWFWIVIVAVILFFIGNIPIDNPQPTKKTTTPPKTEQAYQPVKEDTRPKVTVIDFSAMTQDDIKKWCQENKMLCTFKEEFSDSVPAGKYITQSTPADKQIREGDYISVSFSKGPKPSKSQTNALIQAEKYASALHLSKQRIYDQLTSKYGEKFDAKDARYAIDHLKVNWNANALITARKYQDTLHMSKASIYDQLVSKHGERFTASEAKYAIAHLQD